MKHTLKKSLAVLLAMLTLLGMTAAGAAAEEPGVAELPEEALIIDAKELPVPAAEEEAETEEAAAVSDEVLAAAEDTTDDVKQAAASDLDFQSAEELLLGQPKAVSLSGWGAHKLFKFTPAASGKYCFRSNGADNEEVDGPSNWDIDPEATLYDEDGYGIDANKDRAGDEEHVFNFSIYRTLEAGKTYYLAVYSRCGGDFTVRVDTYSQTLVASKQEITIGIGEYVRIADLIEGTTWRLRDLEIDSYDGLLEEQYEMEERPGWYSFTVGITGIKGGNTVLKITAPDGKTIEVKVKVKLTVMEWIKYYLLFGWTKDVSGQQWIGYFFFGFIAIASFFINIVLFPFDLIGQLFRSLFR